MMRDIEGILRKRYGQERFNPGAGQTQMTFREWMDRHPALQGRTEEHNRDAYLGAVSDAGGRAYYKGRSVGGQVAPPDVAVQSLDPKAQLKDMYDSNMGLPGPDRPPGAGPADAAEELRPVGGSYRDFVQSHGGKSTARLAGVWRGANDRPLTSKMAAAVADRRVRKPSMPKSNSNNRQSQHPKR